MTRPVLNLLTALSLLLCVAVVALWVRSYFAADTVRRTYIPDLHRHGVNLQADFNRGMARLSRYDIWSHDTPDFPVDHTPMLTSRYPRRYSHEPRPPERTADRYLLGFRYEDKTTSLWTAYTDRTRAVVVPLWVGVAVFGALPARALRHRLRGLRKANKGLCPTCGYDLRATPGRCPECGTVAMTPA